MREDFLLALEPSESHLSRKLIPNRHSGTCEWFFETEEYSGWTKERLPQTLVVTAPTGRGKSVLAKYLVERLQLESEDHVILSHFCKDNSNDRKKAMTIIRNLLHQLLNEKNELLRHIPRRALIVEGEKAFTFQNLWDIMIHILRVGSVKNVFCVVDGFDECDEESGNLLKDAFERDVLSAEVTSRPIQARFLITSQPTESVLLLAQKSLYLGIRPEHVNNDILEYVYDGIKSLKRVGSSMEISVELANYIRDTLKERAEGSFQWAKLVLKELGKVQTSRSNIMQVFQRVPKGLDNLYEEAFRKINPQYLPEARKILTVLLFSSRALSPGELAICMLKDPTGYRTHIQIDNDFDHSMGWEANIKCGSFLDITSELINITHQSARQSLMSFTQEHAATGDFVPFDAAEGHRILATSCLSYLLLEEIQKISPDDHDDTLNKKFPFLKYAEANWDVHLRNVNNLNGFENILQSFFAKSVFRLRPWKTAWPQMQDCFPQWEGFEDTAIFHLLVHRGLLSLIKQCKLAWAGPGRDSAYGRQSSYLLAADAIVNPGPPTLLASSPILTLFTGVEVEDALGNTSLMRAMKAFELDVVIWLIFSKDADQHTMDDQGCTITHLAAQADLGFFISILQKMHVDTNRVDGFGYTPLKYALLFGCEKAATILLQNGPGRDPRTGITPLHLVAQSGCETLLQAALKCVSGVNQGTKTKKTALMMASEKGHYGTVLKLLNQGADADLEDNQGMSALHYAAQAGKDRVIQALLEHDVLPNNADKAGWTPLYYATNGGYEEIVRHLITKVSDLDARTGTAEWTALHRAASDGRLNIVKILVEHGARINQVSKDGLTPFHAAVRSGHVDIAQFLATQDGVLLDTATDEGYTPLISAASNGFKEIVSLLLCHDVEVEGKIKTDISRGSLRTPLQGAANGGFLPIVKELIDAKASINSASGNGYTPLLYAALSNHPDVVDFLLDKGANPRCVSSDGCNPLHYAAEDGHEALVTRLLECGVDASSRNAKGLTPVHYACRNGSVRLLERLLAWGGSIRDTSDSGWSPFLEAIDAENEDMTRRLIQMKVDISQGTDQGTTPLLLAAGTGNHAILRLLLENGALCQHPPPNRWSPLHEAAYEGLEKNVALLLSHHHPVDIMDKTDATPLLYAANRGHVIVAKTLLNHNANIKAVSQNGLSFLIGAVRSRSTALIRLGIERGADINWASPDGGHPIDIAIDQGDRKIFNDLLSRGALCFTDPKTKQTALHQAAQPGFFGIVKDLLDAGFDPNARDIFGVTPLHSAAMCYRKTTVRTLIDHGADIWAIDCFGRTAHYWARRRFNHGLGKSQRHLMTFELDPSHRRQRLEQSIRFCIERLLQYPKYNYIYSILGKCLKFEGDLDNARIAFEQRMDQSQRPKMVHIPTCNVCGPDKGIEGYRYVCNSCADIDLCSRCFSGTWEPGLLGRGCYAHKFLKVPGAGWETRPVNIVDANGTTVEEWLRALRPAKSIGLQNWDNGTWTRVEQQMQSKPGFWDLIDVFNERHNDHKHGDNGDLSPILTEDSDVSQMGDLSSILTEDSDISVFGDLLSILTEDSDVSQMEDENSVTRSGASTP